MEPLGSFSSMTKKPWRPGQKGEVVINNLPHKGTGPLDPRTGSVVLIPQVVSQSLVVITRLTGSATQEDERKSQCASFS